MRNDDEHSPPTGADYVWRVNRAIDHVLAYLDRPLPLVEVARVACFSPFHFHRVFRSLVGETLQQFVKRLRLERALRMLSHGPHRSLTQIALACGFASSSDFSRSFRQHYGVAPSRFDVARFRRERRDTWAAALAPPEGRHRLRGLPPGANPDGFAVELRELPPRSVRYIRVSDPFRPGVVEAACARLVAWAEARGVADRAWLGFMWDDPEVVAHDRCRYDIAVVADGPTPDGEVGRFDFPAMTVAQVELRGGVDLELRALDWLFKTWLPSSGFVPAELPCFEAFHGRPFAHGNEWFELAAQIPVVRA